MTKQTLLDISNDMIAFDELIANAEQNLDDPGVQEIMQAWAREVTDNLEYKVDNYAAYLSMLEARAEVRKTEAKRLAERARIDEANADRLKNHLKTVLELNGIRKLETARYSLTVAANGGKQGVEIGVAPEALPKDLQVVTVSVKANTDMIRGKLMAGEAVEGCRLIERGTNLRIK